MEPRGWRFVYPGKALVNTTLGKLLLAQVK